MDWSDKEQHKDSNPLWTSILGSIIGGFIVYLILKNTLQAQIPQVPLGTTGSQQYINDETWHPIRDLNGRVISLSVSRNAQISDGSKSYTTYKSLEQSPDFNPQIGNGIYNRVSRKIDVDLLTDTIQQRLEKRYRQLNKKENDLMRRQRFGMQ